MGELNNENTPDYDHAIRDAMCSLAESGLIPNFLFIGDSVLHVAALNAFLMKMEAQNVRMSGVVLNSIPSNRTPQFNAADVFAIPKERLRYLENNANCHPGKQHPVNKVAAALNNPAKQASKRQSTTRSPLNPRETFYLIGTDQGLPRARFWKLAYSTGMPVACVLLEEGTGSYLPLESAQRLFALKERDWVTRTASLIKRKLALTIAARQERRLKDKSDVSRFGMFDISPNGNLAPNEVFSKWMRASLKKQAETAGIKGASGRDLSRTVVVIGTNFVEMGPLELELAVMEKVIRAVRECNLETYMRPHPRTRSVSCYEEFGVELDRNPGIAFEAVLASASTPPLATVGFCSTTQIMANVLWGVPAISATNLLKRETSQRGSSTPALNAYITRNIIMSQRFKRNIVTVESEADLISRLNEINESAEANFAL